MWNFAGMNYIVWSSRHATDLVKQLTLLIEIEKEIDISLDEPDEPKLKIIYETITEIIEAYNSNLKDFMNTQVVDENDD
jgi:hypothetical protein